MTATWYRTDNMGPAFFESEPYRDLYRLACERGVEIKVNRSNITRGWTYNADIYLVVPSANGNRYMPNGAGSGRNPLSALIDALCIRRLNDDPLVACAILQAEVWLLARAYRQAREKEEREAFLLLTLEQTLDGLTALIRSYSVPAAAPQPIAAKPDEDDDL